MNGEKTYNTGYPMNKKRSPIDNTARAPTLIIPRLLKISHSRFESSLGSGLCSQSSFSTSSGNNSNPADGSMLNFSDTVCVFRSSSLPALDGALESSKGEAKGPIRESRLPADSESQLERRDDIAEGDRIGDSSSRNLRELFDFFGGSSSSAESANGPPC